MEAMAPNLLFVDELTVGDNDINSVVSLSTATMDTLHLSHGDPLLIQGKMGRQIVSIANIAANDTCDIGPKIRLSKVVRNQLRVRIGDVVSLRFSSNHTSGKREQQQQPISLKEDDDTTNLKVSEFLNNVDDKLLFEIFVRVSDCRLAIQLSSVCKRWSSIISKSDQFIRDFSHIHDHCRPFSDDYYCSRPFTLLFRRDDRRFYTGISEEIDFEYFEPFCQVFSEKSKALHGKIPSRYFNFLPCPVAIIASYDELVLATNMKHGSYSGAIENYICNPLTKKWLALPKVQAPGWMSCNGFVRDPISCNKTTDARYRVVMIGHQTYPSDLFRYKYWCKGNEFVAIVFCSETGQWSGSIISFPQHWVIVLKRTLSQVKIVASNGVLYWLEGVPLKGIVAFDPFNDLDSKQCRFIGLPTECFKNKPPSTYEKVHLGEVKGQLRLSQLYKVQSYFFFKVWELKNQDSEVPTWDLVYNLKLNSLEKRMFLLSFHPNNTNVVFLLCGNHVCRYEILENEYEIVGKYPDQVTDRVGISAFTLLYPSWPTQIQQLPSS